MLGRSMDRPDITASQQRHGLCHATLPMGFIPAYRGNCRSTSIPRVVIIWTAIGRDWMSDPRAARLQELIHRRDKVLAVLHPPSAAHARIMEMAGCEALFVGTGGVVGAYTGLADVGTATLSECVEIAGWIADSVKLPVIMDGDPGHGGILG